MKLVYDMVPQFVYILSTFQANIKTDWIKLRMCNKM